MERGRYMLRLIEKAWPVVVLIAALLLIVELGALVGDRAMNRTITEALINVVLVVGLYIFIGNSGIVSFGHVGFVAIAAYASAWQTCCAVAKPFRFPDLPDFILHHSVPLLPAAILSALLATIVAIAVGVGLMKLSGLAASIGTFCFLAIVNNSYKHWEGGTMGTSSVVGIPTYVTNWVALGWAAIAIAAAYQYQNSPSGLSLRASREDEVAALAAGVNVVRQRLVAFALSAFFVGIAGVLDAHFSGILFVDKYYLRLTFITIAMLAVGGLRSLSGAVVGVVALSALIELLRQCEVGFQIDGTMVALPRGVQEITLGVVMLLILLFRPDGIMANREIPWPRRWGSAVRSQAASIARKEAGVTLPTTPRT